MTNLERRHKIQNAQRLLDAHIKACTYFKERLDESAELLEDESRLDAHLAVIENELVDSTPLLESHAVRFGTVARDVTLRRALICRLPNEILREVLTIAIYDRDSPLPVQYTLAGVCGLWRQLTLDIRWPYFHISLFSRPTKIDAMWDFISHRLTFAPRCLHITNVDSRTSELLASKQLSQISTLQKVQITLESIYFPQVFKDSFRCSELSLTHLHEPDPFIPVQLAETLVIAQGVQKLYIEHILRIEVQDSHTASFANIVDLTLVDVGELRLDSLLQAMPSLKTLQLEDMGDIALEIGEDQTMLLSAISTLILHEVNAEWITRLRCPDLTSLAWNVYEEPSLVSFISGSPLLKSFAVSDHEGSFDLDLLVPYCQRVEYLEIDRPYPILGEWKDMGLPAPSFPNLKSLNIAQIDTYNHNPETLQKLIAARCLPTTNPRSTRPPGLPSIKLLFNEFDPEDLEWYIGFEELAGATQEKCNSKSSLFSDEEQTFSVVKWT